MHSLGNRVCYIARQLKIPKQIVSQTIKRYEELGDSKTVPAQEDQQPPTLLATAT